MKKLAGVLLCFVVLSTASSQSVIRDPNAQVRDVKDFHGIEVSNSIDLYLNQGGDEAVAVSAKDPKHIAQIITEVQDGILKIHLQNTGRLLFNTGNQKLKAYVSFKKIDKLSASGSSDIYVDGTIAGDNLAIRLSGSSDFKGSVKVTDLSMDQSGSSDALISGSAGSVTVNVSGASDMKGYELMVENCTAHASGSSDVRITVTKELNVHASGSSDVYYKGGAVVKELRSSGSSSVSRKD